MTSDDEREREALARPAYPVSGGTVALTASCYHLFSPLNPVAMVCMRCGGYASREWVAAWLDEQRARHDAGGDA